MVTAAGIEAVSRAVPWGVAVWRLEAGGDVSTLNFSHRQRVGVVATDFWARVPNFTSRLEPPDPYTFFSELSLL